MASTYAARTIAVLLDIAENTSNDARIRLSAATLVAVFLNKLPGDKEAVKTISPEAAKLLFGKKQNPPKH